MRSDWLTYCYKVRWKHSSSSFIKDVTEEAIVEIKKKKTS